MDVAELIYLVLSESETLEDLVGTRYGPALPQGTALPYVRWDADGAVAVTQSGGLKTARITFTCAADTYTVASEVADAVAEIAEFTTPVVGTDGSAIAGAVVSRRIERGDPGNDDLGLAVATVESLWWIQPD